MGLCCDPEVLPMVGASRPCSPRPVCYGFVKLRPAISTRFGASYSIRWGPTEPGSLPVPWARSVGPRRSSHRLRESQSMLTLIADLRSHSHPAIPPGFRVRACTRADGDALGHLYFEAYDPGDACETLDEAIADIEASFNGDYGEFWFEASPVVEHDGWIVAVTMTARRAPWDRTPDAPFIIELFTARGYRRRGLARLLLNECMATLREAGAMAVALRVGADNTAARSLYESLGFREWEGPA